MTTREGTTKRLFAAVLLMLCMHGAFAATTRVDLWNETALTHAFLFADNPAELQFVGIEFKNAMNGSWSVDVGSAATMVASGPEVQPLTGRMRVTFDYQVPQVSFQWAEVLFDGVNYQVQQSGTATYDATVRPGDRWGGSAVFSNANAQYIDTYFGGPGATAVPLPNSVVLLLSAVAFMGFSRRGDAAAAAMTQA